MYRVILLLFFVVVAFTHIILSGSENKHAWLGPELIRMASDERGTINIASGAAYGLVNQDNDDN